MHNLKELERGNLSSPPARRKGCFILKIMSGNRNHLLITRAVAIKYHTMLKDMLLK